MADPPNKFFDSASSSSVERRREFARLYQHNQDRVFAYLMTLLTDHNDAEEVLQRTSIIIWQKFDTYDTTADFSRWACGIAHLEALSFLRLRHRKGLAFSEEVLEKVAATRLGREEVLDRRRGALANCLQKLAARDRKLVESYYYRGRATVAHIAEQLQRPVGAVYKSLARVRAALHQCIDRELAAEEHS